jgi:hypothetical protein
MDILLLLPTLIIFTSILLIWILRKRHMRTHWFVGTLGILLAWVAIFLLHNRLPVSIDFSIWKPQTLFSTPLLFRLDGITWPLAMTAFALMLVILLSMPSRSVMSSFNERITSLIYLCIALVAILAGNMLSVVITWMFMDVFILALYLRGTFREKNETEGLQWFAKNLISILLLLIAIVVNLSKGGNVDFHSQMLGASLVIVVLSTLLRMPVLSISKTTQSIGWGDVGTASILDIFPALSGISLLGHVIRNGISEDAMVWIWLIGELCLIFSIIGSMLWMRKNGSMLFLYTGILAMGILSSTYGSIDGGILLALLGVLACSLQVILKQLPIHNSWHTVVPVIFVATFAGMPGTLGGVLANSTATEIVGFGTVGIAITVWMGMGILSGVLLSKAVRNSLDWVHSENLTRISYAIGLIFLVLNSIFIGIEESGKVTIIDLVFFISEVLIACVVFYWIRKIKNGFIEKWVAKVNYPIMKPQFPFARFVGNSIYGILLGVGNIFEGENGMLWALVILQYIILAIGNFGS